MRRLYTPGMGRGPARIVVQALGIALVCGIAVGGSAKQGKDGAKIRATAAKARQQVKDAKGLLIKGFSLLQEARSSGDTRKVECVNSALTQMKGLMRLADNSLLEMEEAETANNRSGVDRSATKIKVSTRKVKDANRRLKACMGGTESGTGPAGGALITVEPDPDLPKVDPTEGLKDLDPSLESPPSASPFFNTP